MAGSDYVAPRSWVTLFVGQGPQRHMLVPPAGGAERAWGPKGEKGALAVTVMRVPVPQWRGCLDEDEEVAPLARHLRSTSAHWESRAREPLLRKETLGALDNRWRLKTRRREERAFASPVQWGASMLLCLMTLLRWEVRLPVSVPFRASVAHDRRDAVGISDLTTLAGWGAVAAPPLPRLQEPGEEATHLSRLDDLGNDRRSSEVARLPMACLAAPEVHREDCPWMHHARQDTLRQWGVLEVNCAAVDEPQDQVALAKGVVEVANLPYQQVSGLRWGRKELVGPRTVWTSEMKEVPKPHHGSVCEDDRVVPTPAPTLVSLKVCPGCAGNLVAPAGGHFHPGWADYACDWMPVHTLRPLPDRNVWAGMNRRHRQFWQENTIRRLLRDSEMLVHNYITRHDWMEDCVAFLLRYGYNLTRAVEECHRVYEAHRELAAEDAFYMNQHYWPYVGTDAGGIPLFPSSPRQGAATPPQRQPEDQVCGRVRKWGADHLYCVSEQLKHLPYVADVRGNFSRPARGARGQLMVHRTVSVATTRRTSVRKVPADLEAPLVALLEDSSQCGMIAWLRAHRDGVASYVARKPSMSEMHVTESSCTANKKRCGSLTAMVRNKVCDGTFWDHPHYRDAYQWMWRTKVGYQHNGAGAPQPLPASCS